MVGCWRWVICFSARLLTDPMLIGDVVADGVHPMPGDILVDMCATQIERHVGTHSHDVIKIAEEVFQSE